MKLSVAHSKSSSHSSRASRTRSQKNQDLEDIMAVVDPSGDLNTAATISKRNEERPPGCVRTTQVDRAELWNTHWFSLIFSRFLFFLFSNIEIEY